MSENLLVAGEANFRDARTADRANQVREASVIFRDVLTRFGEQVIYDNISFTVKAGEFVCILGPSGCGKSTALRLMGGLIEPDGGKISVAGGPISENWHRIAYVFQSHRLTPWRTALGNVELGMELRGGWSKSERRARAKEMLELVGLSSEGNRHPSALSGGERQRVAIARALAVDPEIILMDEPFSALDPNTRTMMRRELLEIWRQTGKTIVFVTHDIEEALMLADRVLAFSRKPTRLDREMELDECRPRDITTSPSLQNRRTELVEWFTSMGAGDELVDMEGTNQ